MVIGVLLVGTVVGAVFGLISLILGYSIWMAFLIYSVVGALSALTGALALVFQDTVASRTKSAIPQELSPPQRG